MYVHIYITTYIHTYMSVCVGVYSHIHINILPTLRWSYCRKSSLLEQSELWPIWRRHKFHTQPSSFSSQWPFCLSGINLALFFISPSVYVWRCSTGQRINYEITWCTMAKLTNIVLVQICRSHSLLSEQLGADKFRIWLKLAPLQSSSSDVLRPCCPVLS